MLRPWTVMGSAIAVLLLAVPTSGQTPDHEFALEPGLRTINTHDDDEPGRPKYEFTIEVDEDFVIGDLQMEFVWISLSHRWSAVSEIILTSPEGTSVTLVSHSGEWLPDDPPGIKESVDFDVVLSDYGTFHEGADKDDHGLTTPRRNRDELPRDLAEFAGEPAEGDWSVEFWTSNSGPASAGFVDRIALRFYEQRRALPVDSLACTRDAATVDVSWVNAEEYGEVLIYLNDVLHGSVSTSLGEGEEVSYEIEDLSIPQLADVRVVPYADDLEGHPRFCQVAMHGDWTVEECSEPELWWDPEDRPASDVVSVDDDASIADLVVHVDLTFSNVGDQVRFAEITLESPSGTSVLLHHLCTYDDGDCGPIHDWRNSDSPDSYGIRTHYWALGRRSYPYFDTDEYMRAAGPGSLRDFFGESMEGDWTLIFDKNVRLSDDGDEVQLLSWCLGFPEDGPGALPVDDLTCAAMATSGDFEITWVNSADYDAVRVFLDHELHEVLAGPFLTGATASFEVSIEAFPSYGHVAVQGVIADGPGPKMSCHMRTTALGNLECTSAAGSGRVELSWSAFVEFEEFQVFIDETLEATLDADATTYTSEARAFPASADVRMVGVIDADTNNQVELECRLMLLDEARVEICDTPGEEVDSRAVYTLEVVDNFSLGIVEVPLEMSSDFTWDPFVDLESPDGTRVRIYHGSILQGPAHAVFGDGGVRYRSVPMDCECYMSPSGPGALADFRGEPSEGEWRLLVFNDVPFFEDVVVPVVVDEWCLRLGAGREGVPPGSLACAGDGAGVALTWENGEDYDRVEVLRDDRLIATLDGDIDFYDDPAAAAARHEYRVLAYVDADSPELLSARCIVEPGLHEICDDDVLPAATDDLELFIANPFEGQVAGVELYQELDGVAIDLAHSLTVESPAGTSVMVEFAPLLHTAMLVTFADSGVPFHSERLSESLRMQLPRPTSFGVFRGEEVTDDDLWLVSVDYPGASALLNVACLRIFEDLCAVDAPADLACVLESGDVTLSWEAGGATGHEVRMDGATVGVLPAKTNDHELAGPLPGPHRVELLGTAGESPCSWEPLSCVVEVEQTWTCEEPGEVIAGGDSVALVLDEDEEGPLAAVELSVELPVSLAEEWQLTLESPSGTVITLHAGRARGDGIDVTFSDIGLRYEQDTTDLLSGGARVQPQGPATLGDLIGEESSGAWTLSVSGAAEADEALLVEWCLGLARSCSGEPPIDLDCRSRADGVELHWSAGEPYDEVQVLRNGVRVATLAGDAEEHLDAVTSPGAYHYQVVGVIDDCRTGAATCRVSVGALPFVVSDLEGSNHGEDRTVWLDYPERFPIVAVEVELEIDRVLPRHFIELGSPWGTRVVLSEGRDGDLVLPEEGIPLTTRFAEDGLTYSLERLDRPLLRPREPAALADIAGQLSQGPQNWSLRHHGLEGLRSWRLILYAEAGAEADAPFLRGDADGDGTVSSLPDGLYILRYGFLEGTEPPCMDAADVDDSGAVGPLPDALYLFRWGFMDGPPPAAPASCALDPTVDDTGCGEVSCD